MNLLDGAAPLQLAAREGRAEAVRLLLEAGADVEAEDGNGLTALKVRRAASPPPPYPLPYESEKKIMKLRLAQHQWVVALSAEGSISNAPPPDWQHSYLLLVHPYVLEGDMHI